MQKKKGKLHTAARRGVIALIPKKRDTFKLTGYRPLTMLNTDYKILAKVLATRLKSVFPKLISKTQNGFMEDREISNTLRATIDISKFNKHVSGYLLSIDYEKCFDKIEYSAITGSLKYLGFGDSVLSWCDLLMTDFSSTTSNNGFFSDYFEVTRSCHQGCPVAPLFFLACGEVLFREISQKTTINGITLNGLQTIMAQFADDTQLFLRNKESVEEVVRTLTDIEANTGLVVNYNKSSIHCIAGAQPFECTKPLVWDPGQLNVLGVDLKATPQQNYSRLLDKAKSVFQNWKHRQLSLTGKILVVNTLVASLFVYTMQVEVDPDDTFYEKFEKMVKQFIWKNKKEKVSFELLKAEKWKGGLGLVDLKDRNTALKVKSLLSTDPFLMAQCKNLAPEGLGETFWECNLNEKDANEYSSKIENPYWACVVRNWFRLHWTFKHVLKKVQHAKTDILWYNSEIRDGNKYWVHKRAIRAGLLRVSDLLCDSGEAFATWEEINIKFQNALTWFEFRRLKSIVEKKWCLKQENEIPSLYEVIKLQTSKAKYCYSVLAAKRCKIYTKSLEKFQKHVNIDEEEYLKAFRNIQVVTNITKLRDFQYRLLVNDIHTNVRLYHWKIVETQDCELCKLQCKQTVTHLLYNCKIAQGLWNRFEEYVNAEIKLEPGILILYEKNIMLNMVHPKPGHIINLLVLYIKQYIFACKCLGSKPDFHEIMIKIKQLYNTESYNATVSNNSYKHETKWAPYSGKDPKHYRQTLEPEKIEDIVNQYISAM